MRTKKMIIKMFAATVTFALLCPGMVPAQTLEETPEEIVLEDGTEDFDPDTAIEDGSGIEADTEGESGTPIQGTIYLSELDESKDYYLSNNCHLYINCEKTLKSIEIKPNTRLWFYQTDGTEETYKLTVTDGIYGENNDSAFVGIYNGNIETTDLNAANVMIENGIIKTRDLSARKKITVCGGNLETPILEAEDIIIEGGNVKTSKLNASNNIRIAGGEISVKQDDDAYSYAAISAGNNIEIMGGNLYAENTKTGLQAISGGKITISGGEVTADCDDNAAIFSTSDLDISGGSVKANSKNNTAVLTLLGNIKVSGKYTKIEATTQSEYAGINAGLMGTLTIDPSLSIKTPEGGGISKDKKYITPTPGAQSEAYAQHVVIEQSSEIPALFVSGSAELEKLMKDTANTDDAQILYYGKYENKPLSWFVIGCDSYVTLFSEVSIIGKTLFADTSSGCYEKSGKKDGTVFPGLLYKIGKIFGDFGEKEKEAVKKRDLNDLETPLTGQQLWPLSVEEAELVSIDMRKTTCSSDGGNWWLRTKGTRGDNCASFVSGSSGEVLSDGAQITDDPMNVYGLRPAFYLDRDSILFTSAAKGGKEINTEAGPDSLTRVGTNPTRKWKLTLKDDGSDGSVGDGHKDFKVTTNDFGEVAGGGKVSFDYEGAATGENEFISAILVQKNAEDKILCYGRLKNTTGSGMSSGTQAVTIPEELYPGHYILKVFSEQYNGDKMTDLASGFCDIPFTVKKWTPSSADFNVKLPETSVYDGKPREALAAPAKDVFGMGFITTKYKDEHGTISTEAPTQPGTYTVCLDVDDGNYYKAATDITDEKWTFTIKPVPATGISISEKEIALYPGETHKLTAKVEPEEVTDKSVKWTSDKESIATVDDNGTVTAVAEGVAVIKVAIGDGTLSDTCKVTVSNRVCKITFDPNGGSGEMTGQEVVRGKDTKLKENAFTRSGYNFSKWNTKADGKGTSYNDQGIINISEDTTLYAQWNAKKYSIKVNIDGKGSATASTTSAKAGKKITLTATPDNGYRFRKWSITKGVELADRYKEKTSFIMPEKDITVYVTFEKIYRAPQPQTESVDDDKIVITWWKVKEAKGYDIFMSRCDHGGEETVPKKVRTIKGNKTFRWKATGLKPNKSYKVMVKAYIKKNGKKEYISTSPIMHVFTAGGTKEYTNAKSVKIDTSDGKIRKNRLTLKVKGTYKIKASVKKVDNKKKLMPAKHVKTLRYRSSDPGVASVSGNGRITAKKKGTCDIYVYAHNGVYKTIRVKVK